MQRRIVGAALLAAMLAGCAAAPPMRSVDVSGDCVGAIAALTAHPAFVPDPAKPRVGPKPAQFADFAGCLERDGQREGVALFRIDAVPAPSMATVTMWSDARGTLAAKVELLDAEYRVVKTHPFGDFTRRGMQYTLTVFANAGGPDVRYLLVSPDASRVGESDQHMGNQVSTVFIGTGYYMHGAETTVARPLGDAGNIAVTLQPQGSTPLSY
jgi:hypothetical protein